MHNAGTLTHTDPNTPSLAASSTPDPAPIDFLRTIHYAEFESEGARKYADERDGSTWSSRYEPKNPSVFQSPSLVCGHTPSLELIVAFGAVAFCIWVFFGFDADRASPWSVALASIVVLFFAVVIGAWAIRRWRRIADAPLASAMQLRQFGDDRYRLRVIANPPVCHAFQKAMHDEPESFEARIFRVRRRNGPVRTLLVLAIVIVPVVLANSLFGRLQWLPPICVVTLMIALIVHAFLWPAYVRVAPGRIDLLEYNFLGRGIPLIRSQSLRYATVVAKLPYDVAVITATEPHGRWYQISDPRGEGPGAGARAILAAARSEAPTPPLPTDRLV